MEPKWLTWAKELQAIAQNGLTYSKDVYDIERFEEVRRISNEILATQTLTDNQIIRNLFANETGYATPKVDIRGVIFRDQQLLMVKEKTDNKWALPGGWADVGLSPREVVVKEVKEETGLDVEANKLLAVLDKKCHPHPPSAYHVYKLFIQCEIKGGTLETGVETSEVSFFSPDRIPELSEARNTKSQIDLLFHHLNHPNLEVKLD
ncbi:NUDIX hydrolase [Ornithinibacillus sp. BX22]|uniref:NUDIX hydrolase n=2 Tax=Ornithinibacillus TaxID=484508 RepID=A0A923L6E5_9BACI|nr:MULTISPECIES: NUDIX hydrolase [Ornithinibacillus]MBC5637383.1 NUDIX hydrolase [Ornithinibacillus hominis]MBS3680310.1 NUDIX hydrolase [Ornithinibacillus massiliensis]